MLPSCAILETIQVMRQKEIEYNIPIGGIITDKDDLRSKMVDWCCRVISYCHLDIEIVYIAMNYTDRMCICQPQLLVNPFQYQLVAMTSLYISAKVHAPEALDPKLVSNLSRGTYTEQVIEEQERIILKSLQWKVNPITPHAMIRQYYELISSTNESILSNAEQEVALQNALQQVNTYIVKYHCIGTTSVSMLAYCAFMNSLQYLSCMTCSNKYMVFNLGMNLATLLNIDLSTDALLLAKTRTMLGIHDESISEGNEQKILKQTTKTVTDISSPTRVNNKRVYEESSTKKLYTLQQQQRRYSPTHILER